MTSLISSQVKISNLSSHVKISCFQVREILVIHWSLYNKQSSFCPSQWISDAYNMASFPSRVRREPNKVEIIWIHGIYIVDDIFDVKWLPWQSLALRLFVHRLMNSNWIMSLDQFFERCSCKALANVFLMVFTSQPLTSLMLSGPWIASFLPSRPPLKNTNQT